MHVELAAGIGEGADRLFAVAPGRNSVYNVSEIFWTRCPWLELSGMMQLAVCGGVDSLWRDVQKRLRTLDIIAHIDGQSLSSVAPADALVIANSEPIAADKIASWLSQGKHVLLAPPALETAETIDELCAIAARNQVQLGLWNPDRYLPSRQLIRQQLSSVGLGSAGLIRIHRWQNPSPPTSDQPGLPAPLLCDLDVACWLSDARPNIVFALAHREHKFIQVHIGFTSGAMALIDCCEQLTGEGYGSLSVIGSTGAAYADDQQNMQLLYGPAEPRALPAQENLSGLHWANLLSTFFEAVGDKPATDAGASDWLRVIRLKQAIQQSLESGRAVVLEPH